MGVDRRPTDRYTSDRNVADRTIAIQIETILANLHHLRKIDKNRKMEDAAKDFSAAIKRGESLSPGQRSYVDGIYEKMMSGAALPAVNRHIDKKRKGLRFG